MSQDYRDLVNQADPDRGLPDTAFQFSGGRSFQGDHKGLYGVPSGKLLRDKYGAPITAADGYLQASDDT